ncbi:MAG: amidohydrolase family protein [Paracoccaceae bacterium]
MRTLTKFCLTALAFIATPTMAQNASMIAFENVRIRTMQGERLIEDGYLVVEGTRIASVGEGDLPPDYSGERINGQGAVLMPGLADMHVHYYEKDIGAVYLANGITLVRNLTGSLNAARRDQAAYDAASIAPRVKTSGPIIDGGDGFPNDFFIRARNPDQAIGAVRSQSQSGYDAVKLYEHLDAATFRAAAAEARKQGMKIYAHVPASLDIHALLAMKVDSLEHLDGYAEAMAKEGFAPTRKQAWPEQWANVDRAKFAELARATAEAGSWTVPTFAITYGRIASADPDAYFARPEARLLPSWAQTWRRTAEGYGEDRPFFARSLVEKAAFVSALREAGANILIGTDGPNPFVTPGYAIHDEFAAFKLAGYTNAQILTIATVEAARFIGDRGRTGTATAGAPADLILLTGDPVDDLGVLRDPIGAMVAGTWHSRSRIQEALDRRAERLSFESERAGIEG